MRPLDEISQSAHSTSATEEREPNLEGPPVRPHEASNAPFDRDDKESSSCSQRDDESRQVIDFLPNDGDNPTNWPMWRKNLVILTGISTALNSTWGTALPSNAIPFIAQDFGVTNKLQLVLPVSIYIVGYILGPIAFGPLSETYGRKIILISTLSAFTAFTLGCALAPNWPVLLLFRLFCGIAASAPLAIVGGLFADVFDDPLLRGRAIAAFMATTIFGPLLGPAVSGFISVVSWRWTFWVGLILIGVSWIPLVFLPETFGPTILKRRASRMRKETGNLNIFAPIELEEKGAKHMIAVTLTRPFRIFFFEWIVLFSCLYLAFAYGIFFINVEAYPIVFQGVYHLNYGQSGLAFLPIAVGNFFACIAFILWDIQVNHASKRNASWTKDEEYRRLPLACLGGPSIVLSLFWLAWTSRQDIHWIVPMLSGTFFGFGFLLIFIALFNYMADAYEIYSASALAAAAISRSILGALLPLATDNMFSTLGIGWAYSLLGFLSLIMTVVPFVFIKYGVKIRSRSEFCQYLAAQKREKEGVLDVGHNDSREGGSYENADFVESGVTREHQ